LNYRVKKVFENTKQKPDVILIINSEEPFIDDNFFYATGLSQGIFESSYAILFPDGNVDLIIPELESEIAKKSNAEINVYKNQGDIYDILNKLIGSIKKLGLNFKNLSFKELSKLEYHLPNVDFIDVSSAFDETRLIKDDSEISLIKKACEIADSAMDRIPDFMNDGITEFELAAEIGYFMQKNGADKPAFDIISSFGRNTAKPHYSHGDKKVSKGDFIMCDFGACFKRYNSDITRTFVYGKASSEQNEIFDAVSKAQNIGFEKMRAGDKASEVHSSVESFINNTRFKGRFIHSTGHSLGLRVHDGDIRLNAKSETSLKENMVFTIEPGIYLNDIGGVRIEDDVLIKKDGLEILTKSPRELIEI
jgi:Xaa-Pro dipeptidase